jgi:hypothetical protein
VIVKESVSRHALSQSDAEGFYRPRMNWAKTAAPQH